MSQKKNEGIPFPTEIRVVGSYTDRLLISESGQSQFRKLFSVLFPRDVDSLNSLGLLGRLLDSNDVEKLQGTYMPVSLISCASGICAQEIITAKKDRRIGPYGLRLQI